MLPKFGKSYRGFIISIVVMLFFSSSLLFIEKVQAGANTSGESLTSIIKVKGNTALDKNGVLWVWENDKYLAEAMFDQVEDAYNSDDSDTWVIVKRDGSVWTKGKYDEYIQKPNGEFERKVKTRDVLENISGLPPIQAVDQNYVLDRSGNVWRINLATLKVEKLPILKNIVSLNVRIANSAMDGALDKSGNIWTWEFTSAGRKVEDPFLFQKNIQLLSSGIVVDKAWNFYNLKNSIYLYKHSGNSNSEPRSLGNYRNQIKEISGSDWDMGNDYSLVLKKDGTVWTWSTPDDLPNKPVKLTPIKGVPIAKQVSAKEHGGTVLHQDGTVSSWNYADLGYGKYLTKVKAVKVTKKIKIEVNGSLVDLPAPPVMYNGSVYIPVRGLIEYLGGSVAYANDRVTAKYKDHVIELTLWRNHAKVDGKAITISTPAIILSGTTMIPLRFTGQAIGSTVKWNAKSQTVSLSLPTE